MLEKSVLSTEENIEVENPLPPPLGLAIKAPLQISEFTLALNQFGLPIAISNDDNPLAEPIRSRKVRRIIRARLRKAGVKFNDRAVDETGEEFCAIAEARAQRIEVFHRVARAEGGAKIDIGDEENTRVLVKPGAWSLLKKDSFTVFSRNEATLPMAIPATLSALELLRPYINLDDEQYSILLAWITYLLVHPKCSSTKYPILVLLGEQGSGKSLVCLLLQRIIDPSTIGLQPLPKNTKDIAIVLNNSHLALFDNIRFITPERSDDLCRASSGSVITGRTLYTDAGITILPMHGAFVLNGIHEFVVQSDFAQRCVTLRTERLNAHQLRSESELMKKFEHDLPGIFAGLLDLAAQILLHVESAEITHPNRMFDFVKWLAGMECARGVPAGTFQTKYDDMIRSSQLETLLTSPLANALLEFVDLLDDREWSGTAGELLEALEVTENARTIWSSDWPKNAISLAKRIDALKASFISQGVEITKTRGKTRTILIRDMRGST